MGNSLLTMQYLQHRLQPASTSTKLSSDEISDDTHELDDDNSLSLPWSTSTLPVVVPGVAIGPTVCFSHNCHQRCTSARMVHLTMLLVGGLFQEGKCRKILLNARTNVCCIGLIGWHHQINVEEPKDLFKFIVMCFKETLKRTS